MDMNTAGWEFDSEETAEQHRDHSHTEFFGWCLGELRERRRLFPNQHPAEALLPAAASLMTCGYAAPLVGIIAIDVLNDFVTEWGWATCISLIASAMRELERETV